MILKHEKLNVSGEDATIELVKEVKTLDDAKQDKVLDSENYIHYCYHDEVSLKPCKRVKI